MTRSWCTLWRDRRRSATAAAVRHPLWWETASTYRRQPSYPNWQRKRIQNPCSVSSSLTEGTRYMRIGRRGRAPTRVGSSVTAGPVHSTGNCQLIGGNAASLRANSSHVKKIIATVAAFAVIAPNALLSAQVAQAAPDDPTTTTVVPAPAGGHGPGDRQQGSAATPTPQAPPVPPSPPPPVPAPPPVQTQTPTVPQSPPTVVPTTTSTVETPRVETPT